MRIGGIIVCLAIVGGFLSCTAVSRGKSSASVPEGYEGGNLPYYYHTEGIKSFRIKGDTAAAMGFFRKALDADSLYAPAYYEMAELVMDAFPAQALVYSGKANAIDTANLTYRSQLGKALLLSENYAEALRIYTRLMKDDPNNALNYRLLAALYDYSDQPFTAISVLDTAELRLGRVEELSTYKREMLLKVRLYDKALEETRKMINEYPYDDGNYLFLADLYNAMGKDSLAMENYRQAMQIDSANVNTLKSLADYYGSKQDMRNYLSTVRLLFLNDGVTLKEKEVIFRNITSDLDFYRQNYFGISSLAGALMTRYPTEYSVVDLYAIHLVRSGEAQQALDLYKSFIDVKPEQVDAYIRVISLESHLDRPDSVAKYSDMALKRFPDNVDIMLSKGYSQMSSLDFKGALRTFGRAYAKAGSDSLRGVTANVLGDTYQLYQRRNKSYSMYRKALKYNPADAGALNNYAFYLSENNKHNSVMLEKALALSDESIRLSPGNATYLDTKGWILYYLGRYEEAKKAMQQAISFDQSNSDVLLFHYAEILYALKDEFMAEVYWKRALERGYSPEVIEKRLKMVKGE